MKKYACKGTRIHSQGLSRLEARQDAVAGKASLSCQAAQHSQPEPTLTKGTEPFASTWSWVAISSFASLVTNQTGSMTANPNSAIWTSQTVNLESSLA